MQKFISKNITEDNGPLQFALTDLDGNVKYCLKIGSSGMLKARFNIVNSNDEVIATFESRRSMLEKIKMPFVKVKCANGIKFTAHKDIENLYYMVILTGHELCLDGDVYSDEYFIGHKDKYICIAHPDPDETIVEIDEDEEELGAITYFAVSVAR